MAKNHPSIHPQKGLIQFQGDVKISTEMNLLDELSKPYLLEPARFLKKERAFELSLHASVTGVNALDKEFEEETCVSSISSQEAFFSLNSKVTLGSKLGISLDIPRTLVLEKRLKVLLTGTVISIQAKTGNQKKQRIALKLDKKYKILPCLPSTT
jgi:hypothetical protein